MSEINLGHLDLNLLVTFDVLMREGNVTRAAARLGRTQSAVSHSLARLREQVGDPLMVKAGGRMSPTPFAQKLIEDIRPILRSIQRVVAPPEPFDPATSTRIFRLALPVISHKFLNNVFARVHNEAPGVGIEWLAPSTETLAAVVGGQIDISEWPGSTALPDGVEVQLGQPFTWMTYMRKDHPATRNWGIKAWETWPHLKVNVGNDVRSPVDAAASGKGPGRRVGAWIPHFADVGPLLARTNFLATFPPIAMVDISEEYGLCALDPPYPIAPLPLRFIWSFRLTNDPGSRWFRTIVIETLSELQRTAEAGVTRRAPARARSKK